MCRGQKTPICESLSSWPTKKVVAFSQKARSQLLAFCLRLFLGAKRLTYRRFLSLASHFPSRMPAACSGTATAAFPSYTLSTTAQPSQAARKAQRIIHGNRAAPFSATAAFLYGASLPTTPCACSPGRPHRIWKTTRGTPRNRRARRQATAGRDRRTSPP